LTACNSGKEIPYVKKIGNYTITGQYKDNGRRMDSLGLYDSLLNKYYVIQVSKLRIGRWNYMINDTDLCAYKIYYDDHTVTVIKREVPPEIFDYLELDTVYKVDSPS
jgi:hypothetical protein